MRDWFVRLVLIGTVGVGLFYGWRWLFPGPEQVIRKRLSELATDASITSNEAPLVKLAKAQRLSTFFTTDAKVTVDLPGRALQTFDGREEVQQAAIGARSLLNNLKVEFVDVTVSLRPDKNSAVSHLTATATMPGEKVPEVQELEIEFRKTDHDWLIDRVQTVKTLR